MRIFFVVERPNETRHGDICTLDSSVVDLLFVPITDLVAMVHQELGTLDAIESRREVDGNSFCIDIRVAALQFGRVFDVEVVGDTAVFVANRVESVKRSLRLVAVTDIRAGKSPGEVFRRLTVVTTFRI